MKKIGIILTMLFLQQLMIAQVEMPDFKGVQDIQDIDTTFTYQWSEEDNKWGVYARQLHFIGKSNLVSSVLEQKWMKDGTVWENFEQTHINYDYHGKEVQSITQQWNNPAKDWINVKMKTTTYDIRGNQSEVLYQEWHRPTGDWINTVIYMISYNRAFEKSNVIVRTYSGLDRVWSNYMRFSYGNRSDLGYPSEVIVQNWNAVQSTWQTFGRYDLAYNTRGKIIEEVRATWSPNQREWILGLRYLASYHRDQKTEEIEQRRDYATRNWINFNRKVMLYDEQGEIKEETIFRWDDSIRQWMMETRFLFSDIRPESIEA